MSNFQFIPPFVSDGTDITPRVPGQNIDVGTGVIKDNDCTAGVALASPGNVAFDTVNKDIIGAVNENTGDIAILSGTAPYTSKTDPALNAITVADVDDFGGCVITLTAAGNDQTLPTPTLSSGSPNYVVINNDTSTAPINIIGAATVVLNPGKRAMFTWDGTAWAVSEDSGFWTDTGTAIRAKNSTRNIDAQTGDLMGATAVLTDLTASQIVETDGSKALISAAKATGYNKALGNSAGTVAEGDKPAMLAGRAGGQILIGGTGAGEKLTLKSTSHATRGVIHIDDGGRLAIGLASGTIGKLDCDGAAHFQSETNAFGTSNGYTAFVIGALTGADADNGGLYAIGRHVKSNEPFVCLCGWDYGSGVGQDEGRVMYYGGGGWNAPDAIVHQFYTASTYTETNNTGVLRFVIHSDGTVDIKGLNVAGGIVRTGANGKLSTSVTLPNGTLVTTQSPNDGTTKAASTAYADETKKLDLYHPAYSSTITITAAGMLGMYEIDTSGGDVVVTIPDADGSTNELWAIFSKKTNDVYSVTVQTATSQLIGGAATQAIVEYKKGFTVLASGDDSEYEITADNRYTNTSGGVFSFFLTDTASDIGGYIAMTRTDGGGVESSVTSPTLTTGLNQAMDVWATAAGSPGFTNLQAGVYSFHIHAQKFSGLKTATIYWRLYKRILAGTETLLGTSEISVGLSATAANYDLEMSIPADITLLATDRLILKTYANITGAGTDVVIKMFMEGTNASRLTVPVSSAQLDTRYLVKTTFASTQTISSGIILSGTIRASTLNVAGGIVQTDGDGDFLSSVTLPNGTLVTTQAKGDNSTKAASTAFVKTEIDETISSETAIVLANGLTAITARTMLISGSIAGDNVITANPQIVAGTAGKHLYLMGASDTNRVTFSEGNGLTLNTGQPFTLGLNDTMHFIHNGSLWVEQNRSNNGVVA